MTKPRFKVHLRAPDLEIRNGWSAIQKCSKIGLPNDSVREHCAGGRQPYILLSSECHTDYR